MNHDELVSEVLLLSGYSGSGKSTAVKVLESSLWQKLEGGEKPAIVPILCKLPMLQSARAGAPCHGMALQKSRTAHDMTLKHGSDGVELSRCRLASMPACLKGVFGPSARDGET